MLKFELDNTFKTIIASEVKNVSGKNPICPFIVGEPGIGKSSIIRSMCDDNGWHFFELLCNQLGDRADLTGCRSVKSSVEVNGKTEEIWQQIFFPHKSIQDAITCAKDNPDDIVVLFLDEINRTSSDITSAILSFTTARCVGTYKFPDNVRFIVAGNDNGNVTALDSASISRFAKYALKPSAATWMQHVQDTDVLNPYIKTVLTDDPSLIFCKNVNSVTTSVNNKDGDGDDIEAVYEAFDDVGEGFQQITTPRTISGLNSLLNGWNMDAITTLVGTVTKDDDTGEDITLLQAIVYAHVGQTLFAMKLCNVIANDIQNGQLQKANRVTKPKKPASYSALTKCADRQTREQMIKSMTPEEKSAILLYAVWDPNNDNSDLIRVVAENYVDATLIGHYQHQFTDLKYNDMLNADNYNALISTNSLLGRTMSQIFVA